MDNFDVYMSIFLSKNIFNQGVGRISHFYEVILENRLHLTLLCQFLTFGHLEFFLNYIEEK